MILKELHLKNFRGYEDATIKFNENLNVVIGKNDVGKSTILDAMDIFFNDQKIEPEDCNKYTAEKIIEISAKFIVEQDESVIIDATNPTSLKDEYLLNKEGLFEVRKIFKASGKTINKGQTSVHINAEQPGLLEEPLITYSLPDLKKLLKEYSRLILKPEDVNKTKKADIRKAIYNALVEKETSFTEVSININNIQDEGLKNWAKLKDNLPLFNAFQSDRANTDSDKEVQDPMKAITKEVLASTEIQQSLNRIRDEVVNKVEDIGKETINKLGEFNNDIAKELRTIPDLKSWDSVFNFNLDTDNEIPLNKRGSGVRRLILLSYFRAQAEKSARAQGDRNIIYAIEEPETSQHPNYQKMIIESLKTISEQSGNQVFVTTHTPEIAQMVEGGSLLLISKDELGYPQMIDEEELKIRKVVETLGILPTIHSSVVICVEGPFDISFLKGINATIKEFQEIIDLKESDISIFAVGGGKLIQWINLDHFKHSNTKEFHIYDGDKPEYEKIVSEMNTKDDGRRTGVITNMYEMENYVPRKLIEDEFKCDLSEYESSWAEFDIPEYLKGKAFTSIDDPKKREEKIKHLINGKLSRKITTEMLVEHGVFEEMKGWFEEIAAIYNSTGQTHSHSK